MPGSMHVVMGKLTWASLSDADKKAWALSAQIPDFAPDFLRKGGQTASVEEKMGRYAVFLDCMGWRTAQFRKTPEYLLEDGRPVPHGAVTQDLGSAWCSEHMFDVEGWRTVLRRFVPEMIRMVREGDMERAALIGGLLMHFVQDGSAIGHLFPNRLFYDFFAEDENRYLQYHTMVDNCEPALEPVEPALLGTNEAEFIFRLSMLGERNYEYAKRKLFPMLTACREGDTETMNRIAKPLRQSAVYQGASIFHTALALGTGRLDPAEAAQLADFDLTKGCAYYLHPGIGYGPVVSRNHNVADGRPVPLRADLGRGVQTVRTGLGMTSFSSHRYLLEGGAFARLEGMVALSTDYTKDQEPEMDVEFFIGLDPNWNRTVTSDLTFGAPMKKAFSVRLKPGERAHAFSVELGNARTLLLAVLPHPGEDWPLKCWYPHVVVAAPRLVK